MYNSPQNVKFSGVRIRAESVAIAVKVTERAALPFARALIKLLILPPGQAATKIIPKPMVGVI